MGTSSARWVLLATVLASGIAFLDGTLVNVALPTIAEDLDAGLGDLQWVVNVYLVTLSSLVLLGGSLGDRFGRRRVFLIGVIAFTASSAACGLAPTVGSLIGARAVQGVGAALLVPGSLAIISATFHPDDQAQAVGAWSGLSGVATVLGPFLGGWLIDAVSWRWAFFINVPLAAAAVVVAARRVPESRAAGEQPIDLVGGLAASAGLALATYGLIERSVPVGAVGVAVLLAFLSWEACTAAPMLPLGLFRSSQFSGANGTTLAVYAAGGASFLFVLQLQVSLGYSALEAGAALIPITVLMLLLSSSAGSLAQRIGPRLPMTVGPLGVAVGLVMWSGVDAGDGYLTAVFPGAVVFGLGLSLTVAPLTATIMASADVEHLGVASGINNAVARLAGLLAVAVLPVVVGLDATNASPPVLDLHADRAMVVAAGLAVVAAVVSWVTVRTVERAVDPGSTPSGVGADPCLINQDL